MEDNDIAVLCGCPLFDGIDADDLDTMLLCLSAVTTSYRKGQFIFSEGDEAKAVGIPLSGEVRITRTDYNGARELLTVISPGELFGEAFACAGEKSIPVSAEAACDCRVVFINVRRITMVCGSSCSFHNKLISNLLHITARKNIMLNAKLDIAARRTTREKLLAYLRSEAKKQGGSRIVIPFDRQSLADYIGVERSAMSAELSRMRREGIIKNTKNEFVLL